MTRAHSAADPGLSQRANCSRLVSINLTALPTWRLGTAAAAGLQVASVSLAIAEALRGEVTSSDRHIDFPHVRLVWSRSPGVTNGTQGTVIAVDPDRRSITIRERAGQEIEVPSEYLQGTAQRGGPTLDYAYALTGHKAQGITVDDALVLGSDALYRGRRVGVPIRRRPDPPLRRDRHADGRGWAARHQPNPPHLRLDGSRTPYITSARHRLSSAQLAAEPTAGAVLALEPGVAGLPVSRFAG
jgi:hypothetical protein